MGRISARRPPGRVDRLSRQEASWLELDTQFMEVALLRFAPRSDGSLPKADEVISRAEQLIWHAGPEDILATGRRRLRRVPGHLAQPQWEDDPAFALTRHVYSHRGVGDHGPVSVEEQDWLIIDTMCRPLDLAHPPWRIEIIESFDDGSLGLLLTMHHALADGVSAFAAAAALTLDVTPTGREIEPLGDRWAPEPPLSPLELVLSAARDRATMTTEGVRRVVEQLRHANSRSTAAAIVRLAGYHQDEPPPPQRSTAVVQTWESRRHWNHRRFRIPLLDLRLASRAFGATVTDLLLAATAKSWPAFASDAEKVWVRLPVSLRTDGSVSATNKLVAHTIVGLETTLDPVETLRSAQKKFRSRQGQPAGVGPCTPHPGGTPPSRVLAGQAPGPLLQPRSHPVEHAGPAVRAVLPGRAARRRRFLFHVVQGLGQDHRDHHRRRRIRLDAGSGWAGPAGVLGGLYRGDRRAVSLGEGERPAREPASPGRALDRRSRCPCGQRTGRIVRTRRRDRPGGRGRPTPSTRSSAARHG